MPFAFRGKVIALETSLKGNAKGTYSTETGVNVEGELSGETALVSKLNADFKKLTADSFLGTGGISEVGTG